MGKEELTDIKSSDANDATNTTGVIVEEKYADETLRIVEEHGDEFGPLTPEAEKKLVRKLYWHVMGMLSAINILLFVSKQNHSLIRPATMEYPLS